jgi:hypothetical protein
MIWIMYGWGDYCFGAKARIVVVEMEGGGVDWALFCFGELSYLVLVW